MSVWKWIGREKQDAAVSPEAEPRARVGAERREHVRVPIELEVRVHFASNEELVRSRTVNLSHGGAFVAIRNPRPIGTSARLVLVVGERTLTIAGIIAHTVDGSAGDEPGVGIFFTEVAVEDRALIAELVAAQESLTP